MPSFSERNGFVPPRTIIQLNSLDDVTRTKLWNLIHIVVVRPLEEHSLYKAENGLLDYLWIHFLSHPVDERNGTYRGWAVIKSNVIGAEFATVMDLLEIFATGLRAFMSGTYLREVPEQFIAAVNKAFESNLVGYRYLNDQLIQIDSAEELAAIEGALASAAPLAVANQHLTQALAHLVDRNNPDYRNVIKESIQAVESSVITLTGKSKFSDAVQALPEVGLPSHRALLGSWSKMYGWASDENGLRHGGETMAEIDQALAKYIFGTSATFVAYLVEKARQSGHLPQR